MPLNQENILRILKEKVAEIEPRHSDYSAHLLELVADIVALEREHQTRRIGIVEKIGDKIDLKADDLYRANQ